MKKIEFTDLQGNDIIIYGLTGLKQVWKNNAQYSYIDTPRPDNGITLILCDSTHYEFSDGTEINAPKHSIIYIAQGANYKVTFSANQAYSISTLLINFKLCDTDLNPIALTPYGRSICIDTSKEFEKRFIDITDCFYYSIKNTLVIKSKFCSLLNSLISHMYSDLYYSGQQSSVYNAVKYIEDNLNVSFYIPELAKKCAMSESAFRRAFKENIGMSPIEYINKLKIQKAKQLLKIPEITINSICEQLNFYDMSYFYKIFKKETGVTPIYFRKEKDFNKSTT